MTKQAASIDSDAPLASIGRASDLAGKLLDEPAAEAVLLSRYVDLLIELGVALRDVEPMADAIRINPSLVNLRAAIELVLLRASGDDDEAATLRRRLRNEIAASLEETAACLAQAEVLAAPEETPATFPPPPSPDMVKGHASRLVRRAFLIRLAVYLPLFIGCYWVLSPWLLKQVEGHSPLHEAIRRGDLAAVRSHLDAGDSPNSKDIDGDLALHVAVRRGHEPIVRLLLDRGAPMHARTSQWLTSLHLAVEAGSLPLAKLFAQRGLSVKRQGRRGFTCLHLAARTGHAKVIRWLLEQKADPMVMARGQGHIPVYPWHMSLRCGHDVAFRLLFSAFTKELDRIEDRAAVVGESALQRLVTRHSWPREPKRALTNAQKMRRMAVSLAARHGRLAVIRWLLSQGAEVNIAGVNGIRSPLSEAAANRRLGAVKLLLTRGASLLARKEGQKTPMHAAAEGGHEAVVRLLLANGAPFDLRGGYYGRTPAATAASHGRLEALRILLDAGADLRCRSKRKYGRSGLTLIHEAVTSKTPAVIEELLQRGLTVRKRDDEGLTPLLLGAKESADDACLETLIKAGADPAEVDRRGRTALHLAATPWNRRVLDFFLARRIPPDVHDYAGRTPLMFAMENGNTMAIDRLRDAGADLTARDGEGSTVLHYLARSWNVDKLKLLIESGLKVDSRNKRKETPLMWAAALFRRPSLDALLAAGANPRAVNAEGATAVHYAARCDFDNGCIKALIDRGTDPNAVDNHGDTALHVAAHYGKIHIFFKILGLGARLDICDRNGDTPPERARKKMKGREFSHFAKKLRRVQRKGAGVKQ